MAEREKPAGRTKAATASQKGLGRQKGAKNTKKATEAGRANLAKGRESKERQRAEAREAGIPTARERWAMLLSGTITVKDLDDDEITKMKVRGADGGFTGRRPAIPSHLAHQWQQEAISRATAKFRTAAPEAVERLIDIANDPDTKTSDAIRALALVLERGLGKVPDTIRIEGQSPFDALLHEALDVDRDLDHEASEFLSPDGGQGQ